VPIAAPKGKMPISNILLIVALALTGCYMSSGSQWDSNVELEADTEDASDSQEETDALEGIEYESLPACDPAVVTNRLWEGCGDGILEPGEECNDGNVLDGDGCTWECLEGDGSGGIPGPSPLPLPRYCRIDGIHQVAELERWWAESPILFWWTGLDYRVLFHEVREGPSCHWDQSYIRPISFDRNGENIRTLGEIHHDFHDSE
jgi:cysteine-rich repeat protein